MPEFHFTVAYEGKIEAATADEARAFAEEDVIAGMYPVTTVDVEPISRKDAPNGGND